MEAPSPADGSSSARPQGRIRRLDERTVHEISAGEVIERPASVVKELVENALDAGAREVRVSTAGGGLDRIEVADDGGGILPEDLPLAFERHATSKLASAAELTTVRTLGFRGEALASIAAVAKVAITTRARGEPEGLCLRAEGGRLDRATAAARAPGTTVEVRDLFFNTPARRKFLKSAATESLRITEVVEGLYLAHPEVSFSLRHEGREEVRYPASTSLEEAAARVFGVGFVRGAFAFQGAAGPGLWARGVASHPSFTRGTGRGIVLCVDGRVIVSRVLQEGLRYAYRETLPHGRFPVVVLHLSADAGRVDVNVHPTKREVRFEREGELREALQAFVHAGLRDQPRVSSVVGSPLEVRGEGPTPVLGGAGGAETRGPDGWAAPVADLAPFLPPSPPGAGPSARGLPSPARVRPLDAPVVPAAVAGTPVHPSLLVLGQVGDLYIVGESQGTPRSLVLVDAHAASERVLYERLKATEPMARQELLAPLDVELTPRQRAALETFHPELARSGFVVEPFGPSSFRVHAVPFFRGHRARPEAIGRLLDELADGGRSGPAESMREKVAKSAACHMAIRGGDVLSMAEMQRLLGELYSCPESFTCPHGRPIMLTVPRDRLDRWFLRP